MRGFHFVLILLVPIVLTACGEEQANALPSSPPPEVDIARPLKHRITEWNEFTGQFEAVQRVDVRARVTGYLVEKRFRDGQFVKQGDVLFVIDPRAFEYDVERMEAQYTLANKEYKRAHGLRNSQAMPQEEVDRRLQEQKMAKASLDDARLALEFTQVKAPIDGKISEGFIDIGNLVRENETVLTRIVSVDPVHFEFEGSQAQLLEALRLDRAGKRASSNTTPNPIFVKLMDEKRFGHLGRMEFIDNVVDPGTGTIKGRALVENREGLIYPGMSGRARLSGSGEYEAILLPERSLNTDQNRKFVYDVDETNRIARVYVTPGPILDNGLMIIRDGLQRSERVVVNGIQRIRAADQQVTPVRTELQWKALDSMPDVNRVPSLEAITGSATEAKTQ